ncbi:bifunctional 3'-5' exonuclease/DNA polymerase [Microbacterium pseudoresistens]|uniref:DNA-directed DNA polymerase n=1 Tax=Microbacterium pseudoresistens TaxID=640634 RepID=A0A7Y9EX34_9MICO|nr:DNA polymerase-1 [Microbacterium pseudoresistens]
MPDEPIASIVLGRERDGWCAVLRGVDEREVARARFDDERFADEVARLEAAGSPRWIVRSVHDVYPRLLRAGVRLRRANDLLLCHAILRDTTLLTAPLDPSPEWMRSAPVAEVEDQGLFSLTPERRSADGIDDVLAELARQEAALARAPDARLALLCAAESTGALIAEEMASGGVPWDAAVHDAILTATLGARASQGLRPARMAQLARDVAEHLDEPGLNPDSAARLLRALRRAGIVVESTSRWELAEIAHPVIAPLLEYKKLARLFAANGWAWLEEWVRDGRFRPVYIPGGVVTGRWASAGGGALQLPRSLRPAVRSDPGWILICADVAQLEPRVLAAMSQDRAMAHAAAGADLYAGVVRSGAVATREEAKYAVLGAMYGATTGDSGRLVPQLRKVFPAAMALVDAAARTGEEGGRVATLLGRGSPAPDAEWRDAQSGASVPTAGPAEEQRARRRARDRGRFTRNFVVQGTAAEWSLLWLAEIRHRLAALPEAQTAATRSGPAFQSRAHLAFFLHDEVIVHCPRELADDAARIVREAAEAATTRLFPSFQIEIPLDLTVSEDPSKR